MLYIYIYYTYDMLNLSMYNKPKRVVHPHYLQCYIQILEECSKRPNNWRFAAVVNCQCLVGRVKRGIKTQATKPVKFLRKKTVHPERSESQAVAELNWQSVTTSLLFISKQSYLSYLQNYGCFKKPWHAPCRHSKSICLLPLSYKPSHWHKPQDPPKLRSALCWQSYWLGTGRPVKYLEEKEKKGHQAIIGDHKNRFGPCN